MRNREQLGRALRVSLVVGTSHLALFGAWIVANLGFTPISPFDRYPFVHLKSFVCFEALCILIFLLYRLNRMLSRLRVLVSKPRDLLAEYQAEQMKKEVDDPDTQYGTEHVEED